MTHLIRTLPVVLAALTLMALAVAAAPVALSFALAAFGIVAAVTWMVAVHTFVERCGRRVRAPARRS